MPPFEKNNFGEEFQFCSRCGNPADKRILSKVPLCRKCALEVAAERQTQKAEARQAPKATPSPKEWKVILEDGTAVGPYDLPTLKKLVQQKKIGGFAKISQAGGIWQKAYTVPELAELFRAVPPEEVKPPKAPEQKVVKPAEVPKVVTAKKMGFEIGKLVRYSVLIIVLAAVAFSVYLTRDYLKKLLPGEKEEVVTPSPAPAPELKGTAEEFYQRGVEYLSQYSLEGYQKAEEEFKQALEIDPEFAPALAALAEDYLRWGRAISDQEKLAEALRLAQKSIQIDPNLARGYRIVASIMYYDQKEVGEAEKSALRAVELDKEDWESLYILGIIYFQEENKAELAIKYLKDTIKYYPELLQAYVYLATLYEKIEDHLGALVHRKKIVELKPDSSEWQYALGMCYWRNELLDEAIGSYKKSLELEPERVPARVELIKLLFEFKRDYQEAQENIEILLRDYSQSLSQDELKDFYFISGRIYHLSGSLERALVSYQEVLNLDPKYEDAYYWRGDVYFQQEQFYESEKQYRIILKLNPTSARAYLGWGRVLSRLGRTDLAITQYKKALDLDPTFAEPHYVLGNLYQKREQVFKAIDSYRNAVKLDPGHIDAHYQLAKLSDGVGEAETAIKHYKLVKKIDPKYGDVTYFLGELYLREGSMKKARAEFRRYLKLVPKGTYAPQAKKALELYGR